MKSLKNIGSSAPLNQTNCFEHNIYIHVIIQMLKNQIDLILELKKKVILFKMKNQMQNGFIWVFKLIKKN